MALKVPDHVPDSVDYREPPQTAESPDGPSRGGRLRPPTTGTLPPGGQPAPLGGVLLLVTEDRQDQASMQSVLRLARLLGLPAPMLVCCAPGEAPLGIRRLRPDLIVISDHTPWHWGRGPLALGYQLRQTWRIDAPLVLLYTGRRIFGRAALARVAPDAVVSTTTPTLEIAVRFGHLLEKRAEGLSRQE